ncbi:fructose-1,6-bisphosphatase class 1 [Deltaproteobacteria bacterium]|nr:fructose-1,6-bisphosphatase class 1 [Deltaproteobacteria bacterium]
MAHFEEGTTLDRFLMETMRAHPGATGQLLTLLKQVALAGKLVSARVQRAGLLGMLGAAGGMNIQGEFVQKLDLYANETFKRALEHAGVLCMIVSEEDDGIVQIPPAFDVGEYVFSMDPLDGSSNIDTNASIGTIFAVHRRVSEGRDGVAADVLRCGRDLVCAGYVVYGAGTVLMISTGEGVHGFTLDPSVGEFFLSHQNVRLEPTSKSYSCNEAYSAQWDPRLQGWIARVKDPALGWSARYIGSLVGDFHRNLVKGGVFFYPPTAKAKNGKLRMLYEAQPLAFLAEAAGGAASDGSMAILDKVPTSLHERTPLFIGNRDNVAELVEVLRT